MKLGRLLIDGVGYNPATNYTGKTIFNTHKPYVFAVTLTADYEDISSIENAVEYKKWANDCCIVRDLIYEQVASIGWNNLSNDQKQTVIDRFCHDNNTDKVTFLMTVKGMSQADAESYILTTWHKMLRNKTSNCKDRYFYAKKKVLEYLDMHEAQDLSETVKPFVDFYMEDARVGIDYNSEHDGIADYLMSSNGCLGAGLCEEAYTPIKGTLVDLRDELMDIIVNGNYDKYDD